jgi:hypothetical protein
MLAAPKKLCLLFIVLLKIVTIDNSIQSQTKTTVIISPSFIKVQPFHKTTIDVKIDGVENLFAASVTIAFDSTILHYGSVAGGSFLTRNNANSVFLGVVPQPPPPSLPDKITIDQAICGGGTVSGSGILFTVEFMAMRSGSSPVFIVSNELRNGLNNLILVQTDSGKITVNTVPKDFNLWSPPNGCTIDTAMHAVLVWSKSVDDDSRDIVRYKVHLTSTFSDLSVCDLPDTTFLLTKDTLQENTEYIWYVDATDGIDTAFSNQIFSFKTPILRHPVKIPDVFKVEQNYPNPFNQLTTIRFKIPRAAPVDVTVYDITGRAIIRLMNAGVDAGYYSVCWDGKNSTHIEMGSGIYLYKVTAGSFSEFRKMVFLK